MAMEYKVVSNDLRETLTGKSRLERNPNPLTKELVAGNTVFIEGEDERHNTLYDAARRRGFVFRARKVELEGKVGILGWFEPMSKPNNKETAK